MIAFSPIRQVRLDVRLKELSIGDEIALCHLPENAHEKALTEFLEKVVDSAAMPSVRHIANPRAWSVGERLLVLAHYCMHTRDDRPDYAVTPTSTLSDYLDIAKDFSAKPATFEALGDKWVLQPLTGAVAEALEMMQIESPLKGREHWMIGVMSAQLLREGEAHPNPIADYPDYLKWLEARMAIMRSFPSSSFDVLYASYRTAMEMDTQFFRTWFDDEGVIVLPKIDLPKEAGAITPAARFLVFSALGEIALSITGKT